MWKKRSLFAKNTSIKKSSTMKTETRAVATTSRAYIITWIKPEKEK